MGNNTYCSGEYNYGMPRGGINGRQFSESQGVRNGAGNQWNPGRPKLVFYNGID